MRTRFLIVMAGFGALLMSGQALAHHAFSAEFDANKPVKLQGHVVKMEWVNPHAWIHMEVKNPDGKVVEWAVETGSPNAMFRRGFTKNSVPIGIEIVVDGFQEKAGGFKANGRNVTLPDGRVLFVGSSGTGAPVDGRDPTEQKR